MAIAAAETVTGTVLTGTPVTLTSWTPGANELILVSVAMRATGITPTCAGNGLTFVSVADVTNAQSQSRIVVFRAMGASPSTGSITVTATANTNPIGCIATRFTGVDTTGTNGSGAVEASATNAGPPTIDDDDMLQAVTTVTPEAWAWGAGTYRVGTFAVPGGQNILFDDLLIGSAGAEANSSTWYVGPVTVPAATTVGALNDLNSARDWAMIAVSIKPAGVAVLPTGRSLMRIPTSRVGPMALRRRFRQPYVRPSTDPPSTTAVAQVAAVTVAAAAPQISVAPGPAAAAVTVAAVNPNLSVTPNATVATVTVAANDAAPSTETPISLEITYADTTTDFLDFIKLGSLQIKTNTDRRNGTMDVTLVGTPADFMPPGGPFVENYIRFPYGNDVLFAGKIRSVKPRDTTPGNIEYALGCQDYTYLPFDDVVDPSVASGVRTTVESDFARISWLLTTFTPNWDDVTGSVIADPLLVDTLLAVLPAQDFTGMTIAAALDEICKLSGGVWFIDFDGKLNYGKRGISFIQRVASRGSSSAATTLVATLSSITTTAGHHLILQAVAGAVISSVADSKGNTWQVDTTDATGTERPSVASSKLTTALVSADTITVTWAASTTGAFVVDEFTGLDATTWFDKGEGASGTGTSSDSGATATTTDAHTTLVVGATGHASTVTNFAPETLVPAWVEGTTAVSTGTVHTLHNAYRLVFGEAAAYSAKATWTTSRAWGSAVATYREKVVEAPFGLSDTPNGSTTFGYADLIIPQESTELKNRVVVLGASGYKTLLIDTTSRSLYNDVGRTGVIKDNEILTDADAALAAAVYFNENAYHQTQGTLRTFRSGLVPGMDIDITSANQLQGQLGGTAGTMTFRVGTLVTTYPRRREISYQVGFGTIPRQLPDTIRRLVRGVTAEEAAAIADDAVRHNGATAFPTGPAVDDRFYRTDMGIWFFWDGTRWLSVDIFQMQISDLATGALPLTVTIADALRGPVFETVGSDIWVLQHVTKFLVNGGTALSGSHKWVGSFEKRPATGGGTVLDTVNITSGALDTLRTNTANVNALLGTTFFMFETTWTKTGTPGPLYVWEYVTYRVVAV